ncbi:hypothetical protein HDU93_005767, partial [Gonapodya sp. JEL0774]
MASTSPTTSAASRQADGSSATQPMVSTSSSVASETNGVNGKLRRCNLPLRSVVVLMIILNVVLVVVVLIALTTVSSKASNDDAIAQGTSDIGLLATKIQKDASAAIRTHIANYLDK